MQETVGVERRRHKTDQYGFRATRGPPLISIEAGKRIVLDWSNRGLPLISLKSGDQRLTNHKRKEDKQFRNYRCWAFPAFSLISSSFDCSSRLFVSPFHSVLRIALCTYFVCICASYAPLPKALSLPMIRSPRNPKSATAPTPKHQPTRPPIPRMHPRLPTHHGDRGGGALG